MMAVPLARDGGSPAEQKKMKKPVATQEDKVLIEGLLRDMKSNCNQVESAALGVIADQKLPVMYYFRDLGRAQIMRALHNFDESGNLQERLLLLSLLTDYSLCAFSNGALFPDFPAKAQSAVVRQLENHWVKCFRNYQVSRSGITPDQVAAAVSLIEKLLSIVDDPEVERRLKSIVNFGRAVELSERKTQLLRRSMEMENRPVLKETNQVQETPKSNSSEPASKQSADKPKISVLPITALQPPTKSASSAVSHDSFPNKRASSGVSPDEKVTNAFNLTMPPTKKACSGVRDSFPNEQSLEAAREAKVQNAFMLMMNTSRNLGKNWAPVRVKH